MSKHPSHLEPVFARLRASAIPYRERLIDRIAQLSEAFADDYDGRVLSAQSLSGLIDYLEAHPASGYPDLTATPAGDAYAEWRSAEGRLTREFAGSQ